MTMNKMLQSSAPKLNRGEATIILRKVLPQGQADDAMPWTDMVVKEAGVIAQKELFAIKPSNLLGLSPKLMQKLRDSGHLYVIGEANAALAGNCIGEATFVSRDHVNYAEEPIYRIDGRLPDSPAVGQALQENVSYTLWFIDLHAIKRMASPERDHVLTM